MKSMNQKIVRVGWLLLVATYFLTARETEAQLKIGIVDVNRVFKSSGKVKEDEVKINEAKAAATKEFNERADAYKQAVAEINRIDEQLDGPTLSVDATAAKAKERAEKIGKIKEMEREITYFRQTREQQLQQETSRAKEAIVREITSVVLALVETKKLDLVFDKSGASFNGFSPVLFSPASDDFTDEVIAALRKKEPLSTPSNR